LSSSPRRRKKPALDRETALLITSSVPVEKAFHFFIDISKPTSTFARSLFDFADELKKINSNSLEFHLKRNDFSRWLNDVIRDDWLADEFEKLRQQPLTGEKLRSRLVDLAENRCKQLAGVLKTSAQ
jgi:hypothetical protein